MKGGDRTGPAPGHAGKTVVGSLELTTHVDSRERGQPSSEPAPSLAQNTSVHLPWTRQPPACAPGASEDLTVVSSEHSETTYVHTHHTDHTHVHTICAHACTKHNMHACCMHTDTSHQACTHRCAYIYIGARTQLHITYNTHLHTRAHITPNNAHVHTHEPQRLSEAATRFPHAAH